MAPAAPDEVYRAVTRLFAAIIVGFGVAILAITLANGGGPTSFGFLIGLVFVGLGIGRLYLSVRARS
jgi:RsiW-degrading membrane proteinase PrsW (M82 family)